MANKTTRKLIVVEIPKLQRTELSHYQDFKGTGVAYCISLGDLKDVSLGFSRWILTYQLHLARHQCDYLTRENQSKENC